MIVGNKNQIRHKRVRVDGRGKLIEIVIIYTGNEDIIKLVVRFNDYYQFHVL